MNILSIEILEYLKVILLGIVEGITEWLPVSSTGHMILVNEFIFLKVSKEFWDMFEVVIQLGAIMAVVILYWNKIWPFYNKTNAASKSQVVMSDKDPSIKGKFALSMDAFFMWVKVVVACIPAVVYGLLFDDAVSEAFDTVIPGLDVRVEVIIVAAMLLLVGILFIVIEKANKNKTFKTNTISEITYRDAFIIGLFQLVAAALPGTSRSGATILGAIMIGISRTCAAEFTFYLAIPVMFGASLLKVLKFGLSFTSSELAMLILGMVVAFVISVIAIRFLMGYIKKHDFSAFGWYRIVLGIVVLGYFLI